MTEPSQYFKGRTVQEQMNEVIGYVDTRAAEVATATIASDVAQVHQDMLDADADAQAAAASAAAAAGTLANAVKKTGEASQSIAGDIAVAGNLTGGTVTVPTPVNNTDAANKKYVDDQNALDVHLAGNENITGKKTVPLEATGTFSNQIASSSKVKNELDAYAPMARVTTENVFVVPQVIGDKYQRVQSTSSETDSWCKVCSIETAPGRNTVIEVMGGRSSSSFFIATLLIRQATVGIFKVGSSNAVVNFRATMDGTTVTLWINFTGTYGYIFAREIATMSFSLGLFNQYITFDTSDVKYTSADIDAQPAQLTITNWVVLA